MGEPALALNRKDMSATHSLSVSLPSSCAHRRPKVCCHPELFERREASCSLVFAATWARTPPHPPFGALDTVSFTGSLSELSPLVLPRALWLESSATLGPLARIPRRVWSLWHQEVVLRGSLGGGSGAGAGGDRKSVV